MLLRTYFWPLLALLIVLMGCGNGIGWMDSGKQTPGILAIEVEGTPAGSPAAIEVTGPDDLRVDVASSMVLTGLKPGQYHVAASPIQADDAWWVATPPSQTVLVESGETKHVVTTYVSHLADTPPDTPPDDDPPEEPDPDANHYYLDCSGGDDDNDGSTPDSAWRSLARVRQALLEPGDYLLLKRGCSWNGTLRLPWSGTPDRPIRVGAYGNGDLPRIHGSNSVLVNISGSYLIVESIHAEIDTDSLPTDPQCDDQPYGWYVGFNLGASTTHNTIRNSQANGGTVGITIEYGAGFHRIINNVLRDNVVMSVNNDYDDDDDSGAWGALLNGNDNEVAYNTFINNASWCSYDYGQDGAAIEVFGGKRNYVHHNVSIGDTTFSELGGSETVKAENNTFSYNLMYSDKPEAHFLIVVGPDISFGPTMGTKVYNNTVYLTNQASNTQGVVCYAGCSPELLSVHNNVLWVNWRSFYTDGPLDEGHNIFWRSNGRPRVDFQGGSTMSPTSMVADPRFLSVEDDDFRLAEDSPAIDAGMQIGPETTDLDGRTIPRGEARDIGAYEY